jgi:hypothetical protein
MILQHTKRLTPRGVHFSLHTLATPNARNVNYDEKQLTVKGGIGFRKYVSNGFPIIIFCNHGVHYETPFMSELSVPFNSNFNSKLYIFSLFCYRKKKTEDLLVAIDNGLKADVKTKHSRTRI